MSETGFFAGDRSNGRLTAFVWMVALGMTAIIGSALAFEHLGGYAPCALCLEQRTPYYLGIPLVALAGIAGLLSGPAFLLRCGLLIAISCLLATAAIGAYHSGVEWGWWPGPETCVAGLTGGAADAGSLLDSLATAKPPMCDEAAGRFLGLSFAGWNVLAALALAAFAWVGLKQAAYGSSGASQ